jgi:peptidyl-prolyl cis-trans isomerase A (cyclophilin A)
MMVTPALMIRLLALFAVAVSAQAVSIVLVSFHDEPLEMHWFNPENNDEIHVDTVLPYHFSKSNSHIGHVFVYYLKNKNNAQGTKDRHTIQVMEGQEVYPIVPPAAALDDTIPVTCATTKGDLHISVKPSWSPYGAAHFLELITMDYFQGCALNRVVKKFLTQFGISADYDLRTKHRSATIPDDPSKNIPFQPGYMSYAGHSKNSRTTEMFVVMPGASPNQLANFGSTNPWETPFGFVDPEDLNAVVDQWHAYGDMPPWGKGPDPQAIYEKSGYDKYLALDFPEMSYIHYCQIGVLPGSTEEVEL